MNRLWRELALVAILAGLPAVALAGQDPPSAALPPDKTVISGPGTPATLGAPIDAPVEAPAQPDRPRLFETRPVKTYVHNYFQAHGLYCYANMDSPTCTNVWTELRFVFGSCRSFFGEPCFNPRPDGFNGINGMNGNGGCGPGGCR
jgi:hypothetical protein